MATSKLTTTRPRMQMPIPPQGPHVQFDRVTGDWGVYLDGALAGFRASRDLAWQHATNLSYEKGLREAYIRGYSEGLSHAEARFAEVLEARRGA